MRQPQRPWLLLPPALLVPVLVGCPARATVRGTVTWEGNPVAEGYITFYPADRRGAARGGEVVRGQYTVAGLVPGMKRVRVVARPRAVRAGDGQEVRLLPPANPIPEDAVGNKAVVEVIAGAQTLDLDLKKPASRPAR